MCQRDSVRRSIVVVASVVGIPGEKYGEFGVGRYLERIPVAVA